MSIEPAEDPGRRNLYISTQGLKIRTIDEDKHDRLWTFLWGAVFGAFGLLVLSGLVWLGWKTAGYLYFWWWV